jgi:hypothetical protein
MYRRKIVMAMLATIAFFHSRTNCQKVGSHHLYAEKAKKENPNYVLFSHDMYLSYIPM